MQESGRQNTSNGKNDEKTLRQSINFREAEAPIPKPTTDLGFRGIRHMRRHDGASRRPKRDN